MINHGYALPEFLHSSIIPLPKGARADLFNSDMYRGKIYSGRTKNIQSSSNIYFEHHK